MGSNHAGINPLVDIMQITKESNPEQFNYVFGDVECCLADGLTLFTKQFRKAIDGECRWYEKEVFGCEYYWVLTEYKYDPEYGEAFNISEIDCVKFEQYNYVETYIFTTHESYLQFAFDWIKANDHTDSV